MLRLHIIFIKFLLFPWVFLFAAREFGPIDFQDQSGFVYSTIILFVLSCIIGSYTTLMFKKWKGFSNFQLPIWPLKDRLIYIFLILSAIYLLSFLIDAILFRNIFELGISGARMHAEGSSRRGSLLGAIHTITSGAPVILACLLIYAYHIGCNIRFKISMWMFTLICFVSYFLTGGRNAFFVGMGFVFCFYCLIRITSGLQILSLKRMVSRKNITKTILFLILMGLACVHILNIFVERFSLVGESMQNSIERYVINQNLTVSSYFFELFSSELGLATFFIFYYISHPLNYFDIYLQQWDGPLLMGSYSFYLFASIIDKIMDFGALDVMHMNLLYHGVYISLPGSLFLDFDLIGVYLGGFLIGMCYSFISYAVKRKMKLEDVFLLSFILLLLLYAPVYSVTSISQGPSILLLIVFNKIFHFLFCCNRSQLR